MKKQMIKILLIEDNKNDVMLVKECLANDKHVEFEFEHVERLDEATKKVNENIYDVVLLDLTLPDSDGIETVKRTVGIAPHLPIIAMTGINDNGLSTEALQAGAEDYLIKGKTDCYLLTRSIRYAIERKRAETLLRISEDRYRTFFENTKDVFYRTDMRGIIKYVSPSVKNYGYAIGEVIDEDVRMFYENPAYRDVLVQMLMQNKSVQDFEIVLKRKDGVPIPASVSAIIVLDSRGNPLWIDGILRDISERKEAEQSLQQSEEKYKAIVENTFDLIYTYAIDGTVTFISPNVSKYGYMQDDIIGHNILEFIHPDDRERIGQEFEETIKTGAEFLSEARILKKDGSFIYAEELGKINWIDGEPAYITGVIRDITERRRAEQELKLRANLLDATNDSIIIHDFEGNLIYVNEATYKLRGYSHDELLKINLRDLMTEEYREMMEPRLKELQEKGKIRIESAHFRKDKSIIYNDVNARTIELDGKKVVMIIGQDITEKKLVETKLLRSQRMESVGVLAGGIAHDLNNVLAPILMATDLLSRDVNEGQKSIVEIIRTSAKRGANIVKQVLTFARGQDGELAILQPKHIVREIETLLRETFPKDITISAQIEKDLLKIKGDATQLHQVLLNLSVNARDAMPNGGKITIKAENILLDKVYERMHPDAKEGTYLLLRVADTGTGIPEEIIGKIFDPFFTTKEVGKGTGLGLSTVLGIVKSHGGFINVYSEVEEGTEFKVYIPAVSEQGVQEIKKQNQTMSHGKGELILIVDDEETIREISRSILESFGYKVLTANDGVEAVTIFAQYKDDIKAVITDMSMPVMGGAQTVRILEKMRPNIKIIVASGLVSQKDEVESLGKSVRAFLQKPYVADKLLKTLEDVLSMD